MCASCLLTSGWRCDRRSRSKRCSRRLTARLRALLRGTSSAHTCSWSTVKWRTHTHVPARSASSCLPSPVQRRIATQSCASWILRLMARSSAAVRTDSSPSGRQACCFVAASPLWSVRGHLKLYFSLVFKSLGRYWWIVFHVPFKYSNVMCTWMPILKSLCNVDDFLHWIHL